MDDRTDPLTRLPGAFRNRVTELRFVPASELHANPKNWRRHPEAQKSALTAMLDDVGFVGAVIARQLDDGTLELIDGHLRAGIVDPTESVPVLVCNLTAEEADKVLATHDPLAAMAATDGPALEALLGGMSLENAELRKLMADQAVNVLEEVEADGTAKREVEGMALSPHEHYDYLVVLASTTHEWNVLCDKLGLKPTPRRGGMGTARGIKATALRDKLK